MPSILYPLLLLLLLYTTPTIARRSRNKVKQKGMKKRMMLRSKVSPGEGTFYGPAKLGISPLTPTYHAMDRPLKGTGKPIVVNVGIKLIRLIDVSDIDQLLTIDILFNIKWIDERLVGLIPKNESPSRVDPMQIWTPGISIANAASPPELLSEGIKLSNDGTVEISRNGLYSAAVEVDVSFFPFDIQEMEILFECPDYDGSQVVFVVNQQYSKTDVDGEEIWALDAWKVGEDTRISLVNGEPDSYLIGTAQVRRLFSMAVVTLVAPLYIIANFSFMAFFVFIGDFPTRVGIVSTGFLTLIAFMFVVNDQTPKIAYWTWLHMYTAMTIVVVLIVQVEVTFVHFLDPKNEASGDEKLNSIELEIKKQQFETDVALARSGSQKLDNVNLTDEDFDNHDVVIQAGVAFIRVDFDHSNRISINELMSALNALGHQLSRKEAEEILRTYSFDVPPNTLSLTRPEFITYCLDANKKNKINGLQKLVGEKRRDSILLLSAQKKACCGLSSKHALRVDYWSKRVLIIGYTLGTLLMLLSAKIHRENRILGLAAGANTTHDH